MRTLDHFIAGRSVPPIHGTYIDNINPATGEPIGRAAAGTADDVDAAVDAAVAAFPDWAAAPAAERSRLLLAVADRIDARRDELARAETDDTGKPLALARSMDIPRAAANFRFFATAILHTSAETFHTDSQALNYVTRRPRGVAGLISPWNLPLYLFSWKVAPALATGNTCVAKPSELTPTTATILTEIAGEVGLPPGVFNVVHGTGAAAGAALVAHRRVPTISFTGGTATGAAIAASAGPLFKKLALELGGKNPTVVFADADVETALAEAVRAAFANQGQVCLCGSRVFVERPIYAEFARRFVERARALTVGDPLDPSTHQGALISAAHRDKVTAYIRLAIAEGGRVECGGGVPAELPQRCRGGFFVEPTVVTGLPADCRVNREEIFGPVVTLTPFADEADVIAWANGTPYGLSASVWTSNLNRAHRVAERLECGTVWVNCWLLRDLRVPFGGMKSSGVGREGGDEALRFFTEPKTVCVRTG